MRTCNDGESESIHIYIMKFHWSFWTEKKLSTVLNYYFAVEVHCVDTKHQIFPVIMYFLILFIKATLKKAHHLLHTSFLFILTTRPVTVTLWSHIMSLLRIVFGLLCLVVVTLACPNATFVGKHVCTTCGNNTIDADHFAVQADNFRRHQNPTKKKFTDKNSVFIAHNMHYTSQGHYCIFQWSVPKYQWQLKKRIWGCKYMQEVIATHDATNSHYYYNLDQ